MRGYRYFTGGICVMILVLFVVVNFGGISREVTEENKEYKVDIERATREIDDEGFDHFSVEEYGHLLGVYEDDGSDTAEFLKGENTKCEFRLIDGKLYRFEYTSRANHSKMLWEINLYLGIMAAIVLGSLFFVYNKIIKPFHVFSGLPYELAKGNLSVPLKENRNKYFGHFLWGMDVLRQDLETKKNQELKYQKEKKTLLLSITHDINTPLSAMKLSVKALQKDLYKDPKKKAEILDNINDRITDIEQHLTDLTQASRAEIIQFEVNSSEFYQKELICKIEEYYKEKMEVKKVELKIERYRNCLLKGDLDRAIEVMQNLMENAIKYGGGSPIHIGFSEEEDCKIISVSNKNCTLSDEEMTHIFDSFWRGSNGKNIQGNGLGLHICRELMRKMGGDIYAVRDKDEITLSLVFQRA